MLSCRGFTLVEAVTTLALAAVLASAATPGLRELAGSMRTTSACNELVASLLFTRSEATKRKLRVVMCRSADGATCAATGSWQQGWIVFADGNGDGERGADEALLQVQPPLAGTLRFAATSTLARYVSYAPNGTTRLTGGGFQAGTLTVCSESRGAATGRQIVINASGRPRTQAVRLPSCA